jgi:hypothetical protein
MAYATDAGSVGAVPGGKGVAQQGKRASGSRRLHVALWVVQGLLAALFLFAGVTKLGMPAEAMAKQMPFPVSFMRFIGVCEVMGGLGLVLPSLLRVLPHLTPLAAAGLVVIMVGATVVTVASMPVAMAILPFVTGVLLVVVAYGRWRVAPIAPRS